MFLANANCYYYPIVPNCLMEVDQYEHYLVVHQDQLFLVAKLHRMMIHLNVVVVDVRYHFVDYSKKK